MGKIKTVTYGATRSRNYQSERVAVEVVVDDGEDARQVLEGAKAFVRRALGEDDRERIALLIAEHGVDDARVREALEAHDRAAAAARSIEGVIEAGEEAATS